MHEWYDTFMDTERVTITLPADLLAQLDAIAESGGVSRSSVVREASMQYVAGAHEQSRTLKLKASTADLLSFLDEIRTAPVLDDRPVIDILRELRGDPADADAAAPDPYPRR